MKFLAQNVILLAGKPCRPPPLDCEQLGAINIALQSLYPLFFGLASCRAVGGSTSTWWVVTPPTPSRRDMQLRIGFHVNAGSLSPVMCLDGQQWVHLCSIWPVISLNCDDVVCKKPWQVGAFWGGGWRPSGLLIYIAIERGSTVHQIFSGPWLIEKHKWQFQQVRMPREPPVCLPEKHLIGVFLCVYI